MVYENGLSSGFIVPHFRQAGTVKSSFQSWSHGVTVIVPLVMSLVPAVVIVCAGHERHMTVAGA